VLEIRQLQYFVAVAKEQHVGRAAAGLQMSQSPLSRQISKLETQLGVRLFNRANQRITLSPDGQVFLVQAQKLLEHAGRLENLGRRLGDGEEGAIRLGHNADAMHTGVLPAALRSLRILRPEARVCMEVMPPDDQFTGLRQGSLDVAFTSAQAVDEPGLQGELLHEETLLIALPVDSSIASAETVLPNDLDAFPWIAVDEGSSDGGWRSAFFRSGVTAGFAVDVRLETTEPLTALNLVSAGLGATLIQRSMMRCLPEGVVARELPWSDVSVRLWATWHRNNARPILDAFRLALGTD